MSCDRLGPGTLRDGVPAGRIAIVAEHPAAGRSSPETVRVLAGREKPGIVLRIPERFDPERAGERAGRRRGVVVEVSWRDGRTVVRDVARGSEAERADLRQDDVLAAIDRVEPSDAAEARRLLRGAPGAGAVVRVERGERGGRSAVLFVPREVWLPMR